MTMRVPASMLEENIERVIDSVVRNVNAGRGAVPDMDASDIQDAGDEATSARATMEDLCGHVAYALKSLEGAPLALAGYRAPETPASPPTLNLIR